MKVVGSQQGFTLIELLIVLVVITILAMVAYPSYQDQVRKTRRGEAQSDLMELAGFMERYFTENNTYIGAVLPFCENVRDAATVCNPPTAPYPARAYYVYTVVIPVPNPITDPDPLAYTLTATAQSAGEQSSDGCGNMTVNQLGVRTKTGGQAGCW